MSFHNFIDFVNDYNKTRHSRALSLPLSALLHHMARHFNNEQKLNIKTRHADQFENKMRLILMMWLNHG